MVIWVMSFRESPIRRLGLGSILTDPRPQCCILARRVHSRALLGDQARRTIVKLGEWGRSEDLLYHQEKISHCLGFLERSRASGTQCSVLLSAFALPSTSCKTPRTISINSFCFSSSLTACEAPSTTAKRRSAPFAAFRQRSNRARLSTLAGVYSSAPEKT